MPDKKFPIDRFSPAIQEMCRLKYRRAYGDTAEPIDYINRFSLTGDDIPDLLYIAGWLGQELTIGLSGTGDCWDAPRHAWKALSLFEPIQVVPQLLDLLNHLHWDYADTDFLQGVLGELGKRSAEEAKETGNASLNMLPLFLAALKERERHSTTHMVLTDATRYMTYGFAEYHSEFYRILQDDLAELRIGCREWYVEAVCDLAFVENPSPELVSLLNKACREGYAETFRYWENDGLIENFGFDFENDPQLIVLHKKSNEAHGILSDFDNCDRTFPHQAVQKARELRDWIIPNLIEVIRDATAYTRFQVQHGIGTTLFAVHLLAEFQAKEALPVIFDSLSLSSDDLWDSMYGEGLDDAMPGILNRLIGDNPDFYDQKLRDPQTPVTLKCCLAESLRYLVARKIISVETYGSWLRDYLEIAIQTENNELVTDFVCDIFYTATSEELPLIRSAFEKGLVDEDIISLEDVEEDYETRTAGLKYKLPDPKRDFSDAVKELSPWAWFQKEPLSLPPQSNPVSNPYFDALRRMSNEMDEVEDDLFPEDDFYDDAPEPLRNKSAKIGRNDPCPCGSGKKYKKCCLKSS